MSTSTTLDRHVPHVVRSHDGFFARMFRNYIESRQARARAYVQGHLASMSEDRLKGLGLSADEIAHLRTYKAIPTSFWS